MRVLAWAVAFGLTAVAAGCGDDSETVRTVTEETTETVIERPPAKTVTEKARPAPASKPAVENLLTVPDVVGMNHQYAQDDLQAAGFYALNERDATGQDRLMLWDRNWVVVSQDPPAGSRVSEDTTITLSSKKEGE